MKLEELKSSVLKLLEEYAENKTDLTDDQDIALKMNDAINKVLFELSRMKKILAKQDITTVINEEYDLKNLSNFYQLKVIKNVKLERVDNFVTWLEDGIAKVYYYRYPTFITDDISDDFTLELSLDALNIAPIGIAGTILLNTVSDQYGRMYLNEYEKMLQRLDSRISDTSITFGGSGEPSE